LAEASSAALELKVDEEVVAMLEPVVEQLDQPGLWGNLALAQARLGDEEGALEAAERALALDAANVQALEAQEIAEASKPSS
jgi:predicted Zn-dependent protease